MKISPETDIASIEPMSHETLKDLAVKLAEALRELLSSEPGAPGYQNKYDEAEEAVAAAECTGLIVPQD